MFSARFDDLAGGTFLHLVEPIEEIVAHTIADVGGAFGAAREASRSSHWVAGYVTYDAAPAFDPALTVHDATGSVSDDLPLVWFGVFRDRIVGNGTLVTDEPSSYSISRWTPMMSRAAFSASSEEIAHRIRRGDAEQVTLAFPIRAAVSGDSMELYEDLIASQEGVHACLIRHAGISVVSVSPEQFIAIGDGRLSTRPMKGTRSRGRWSDEDETLRRAFEHSDRDRAENRMVVAQAQSELARVAIPGSVQIDELFCVEPYRTAWQMTSQLSADLLPDTSLFDVFAALFPSGSVTGVPRAAAMGMIAAAEPVPRGLHCGAIGLIPPGDGLDGASFTVAIRTAVVHEREGIVDYGVGGGLTAHSDASDEYDEALVKARVLGARTKVPGLVETVRWDSGWLWLEAHEERLRRSADYFGCRLPGDFGRALEEITSQLTGPSNVRVSVHRDRYEISVEPAPPRIALGPGPESEAVHLMIDLDPVDRGDPHLYHKTLQRNVYEQRARRHPEVDDVVLTNDAGNITESTDANIVLRFGDDWVTPPVADGLLPGILRDSLIREGIVAERSVSIREAYEADAVALVSSVRGWRPAVIDRQ